MAKFLLLWTQLVEAFGVTGAIALVLYVVLFLVAIVGIAVEAARRIRTWQRHRAVGRELEAVHRDAYREHRGR